MEKEDKYVLTFAGEKEKHRLTGIIMDKHDFENEESFFRHLLKNAKFLRNRLPVAYPVYYFLEADMRYLAFILFHGNDYCKVKLCIRTCHDRKRKELGIYVGNYDDRFYLYELLGKKAKEKYHKAVKKEKAEEDDMENKERKVSQPDPGYETDYRLFQDEEDEGLLYED